MTIITVATDLNNFFLKNFLIPSCQYFKYDLKIINPIEKWDSHRMKDTYLISYLEGLDKEEVVMFSDAYDTLVLNDFQYALKFYEESKASILFSAEINCWPEKSFSPIYEIITPKEKVMFLNSGGFIGKVHNILKILKNNINSFSSILESSYNMEKKYVIAYDKKYKWSNQYFWTLAYFAQNNQISLDSNSKIFKTFGTPTDYFFKHYNDFLKLGVNSDIYKKEFFRISNILKSLHPDEITHAHFNNPICKHILMEMFLGNSLPEWINNILKIKKIKNVEIIKL